MLQHLPRIAVLTAMGLLVVWTRSILCSTGDGG
jgi:hypothetical protein